MKPEPSMTPAAISERLRRVDRLWRDRRSQRAPVDSSAQAISRRLRQVSELRELCLKLGRTR